MAAYTSACVLQASKNLHNLFRTPCVQCSVRSLASFQAKNLKVVLTDELQTKPDPENLVFGKQFADHMLKIRWTQGDGWNSPVICPLHPLSLHPAAKVFHYAVELFEGMKAYRGADNKIRLFRPAENMSRMNESSKRASLPTFDGEELIKCIKKLISIDKEWVPYSTTSSLYIRPTLVGTEPTLGVTTSSSALLFVIIGPVGPYYPTGMKPITLLADSQFVRSWTGGAGASKMGSNYGPTLMVQNKAVAMGCQQVLWLFGENRQLTEVGAMNLFIYWINENGEHELVTPPLNGLILPGVTRKSLLELTRQWGEFKVSEREITMFDFQKALNENRVKEVFGSGTACVVCPVKAIQYEGQQLTIPTDDNSPLTNRCLKELTDIQFGRTPSDWTVVVE